MGISDTAAQAAEKALFQKYKKTRKPALRNAIIMRYIYVAEAVARHFSGKGIDYDDLFQVACLGLLYAAERFDPGTGNKFTTFATPTVTGEVKRYFRDKGNIIRIPRRLYEIFVKADRIWRAGGGDPDKYPRSGFPRFVSLDQEISPASDLSASELLGYDDEGFLSLEEKDFVQNCLGALTDEERDFVRDRYQHEHTQKEIAAKLGTSQMFVSRMERKVLKKLKAMYLKSMR